MSESGVLKVVKRDAIGGARVRRLRESGLIPAVIYGKDFDSIPVAVKKSDLREGLIKNGKNSVFNVELKKGKSFPIIIKEMSYDNLKNEYVHLDLQAISLTERRRTMIPVRISGREIIEAARRIIVHQMDAVEIECLPLDTPEHFEADASKLQPGDSFTAGQLVIPDKVTLVSSTEDVIFSVNEARQVAETEGAGEEAKAAEGEDKAEAE